MRFAYVLILVLLCPLTNAATLYRWVDETGKVQYSDKPPAGTSKTLLELDKYGRVRKGNEPVLSPAEKAALEEKNRIEVEKRRLDRALLQSFSKPEEIDLLSVRQIEGVEAGIQTNMLRRAALVKRADQQQLQVTNLQKHKRPIPADMQAAMDVTKKEIADVDKMVAEQQANIIVIKEKSAQQKKRYIELKSVQPN